jgi:hypothetical protein
MGSPLNHFTQSIPAPTMPRPGAAGTPTPRNPHLVRRGGPLALQPAHSWSENSIPIMIRALRGQLCRRRAQAQFQRILRDADPRLRVCGQSCRPWPHASSEPLTVPARTKPTQGRNSPTMSRTLNTTRATTGRRMLADVLAAAVAILTTPATSTPGGATGPPRGCPKSPPDAAQRIPRSGIQPRGRGFPGEQHPDDRHVDLPRARPTHHPSGRSASPIANTMPSRTEFTVTEKDSPGTISVKKLSVLFWVPARLLRPR